MSDLMYISVHDVKEIILSKPTRGNDISWTDVEFVCSDGRRMNITAFHKELFISVKSMEDKDVQDH